MIIKENGAGDYLTGLFDDIGNVSTPEIEGLADYPILTDPTTGLAASSSGEDIFFITGFGDFLSDVGTKIVDTIPSLLQSIFKPAATTDVVAKPTSTGVATSSGISTNMLLIGAVAIGGYFLFVHK